MIDIKEKKRCTGCGACASVCPVSCIAMQPDAEGFLYPDVNKELCIACGRCEKVCPVKKLYAEVGVCLAYAAISRNEQIRKESSSGGVFTELAQYILANGGVVFGAAFDEKFKVRHIWIEDEGQLHRLRGSKYVQSEIGDSFHAAKKFLEQGRMVYFSGTPCQIAGLHSFLGKQYANLYTQDIICHGTPSPSIWERYIKFREAKAGSQVKRIVFRNKENGWRSYSIRFEFANNKIYDQSIMQDPYMQSFLTDLCLRPSCYDCAFKSKHRTADITLADFWGVQNYNPNLDDNRGTSLVLALSEKGRQLISAIGNSLQFDTTECEQALSHNPSFYQSASMKAERSSFMHDIFNIKFSTIKKRYFRERVLIRFKRRAKIVIKRIFLRSNI